MAKKPASRKQNTPEKPRVPVEEPRARDSLWVRLSIPAVVVAAILVMAAIPLWGHYQERILPGMEPVAEVRDTTITMDDLLRRVRYERARMEVRQAQPEEFATASMQAVFDLVDLELIRQGAEMAGLEIGPDDIADAKIAMSAQGVSGDDWPEVARANATRRVFEQHLQQSVPARADQVRVEGFTLYTEREAEEALERIREGEPIAELAAELSSTQRYAEAEGNVGWIPRGLKEPRFEEVLFATGPGDLFGPVNTREGHFVGRVVELAEDAVIEGPAMREMQSTALRRWLDDQRREDNPVRLYWDSEKYAWVNAQVRR